MPSRAKSRRTNLESKAFKSEIIRLRGKRKSIVEIAKLMGVSKQYVSSVLINAGMGPRAEMREKMREKKSAKMRAENDDIDATISRLEKRGDYSLAGWLAVLAQRRKI